MIRFACTGCDARFTVDDSEAGRVGECPACRARFVIPGADPRPLDEPSLPVPDDFVPPPPADPNAPVAVRPCPVCGADAAVRPRDVGHRVACPACDHEYRADPLDATLAPRPKRRRRREWGDDDRYDRRRRSRSGGAKPGNVTAIGAMLLAGGIYGLVHVLGLLVGSTLCCAFWPPWWVMLVWSILAIVRGSGLLGESGGAGHGRPWVLQTLQILCILNFDVVNCVLGTIGMVLAGTPETQEYFEQQTGYAADDE